MPSWILHAYVDYDLTLERILALGQGRAGLMSVAPAGRWRDRLDSLLGGLPHRYDRRAA